MLLAWHSLRSTWLPDTTSLIARLSTITRNYSLDLIHFVVVMLLNCNLSYLFFGIEITIGMLYLGMAVKWRGFLMRLLLLLPTGALES